MPGQRPDPILPRSSRKPYPCTKLTPRPTRPSAPPPPARALRSAPLASRCLYNQSQRRPAHYRLLYRRQARLHREPAARHLDLDVRVDGEDLRQGLANALADAGDRALRTELAAQLLPPQRQVLLQPREPVGEEGVQVEAEAVVGQVRDGPLVERHRVLLEVRVEALRELDLA